MKLGAGLLGKGRAKDGEQDERLDILEDQQELIRKALNKNSVNLRSAVVRVGRRVQDLEEILYEDPEYSNARDNEKDS